MVALAGVVEEAVGRAVVDVLLDGLAAGVQLALQLVRSLCLVAAVRRRGRGSSRCPTGRQDQGFRRSKRWWRRRRRPLLQCQQ